MKKVMVLVGLGIISLCHGMEQGPIEECLFGDPKVAALYYIVDASKAEYSGTAFEGLERRLSILESIREKNQGLSIGLNIKGIMGVKKDGTRGVYCALTASRQVDKRFLYFFHKTVDVPVPFSKKDIVAILQKDSSVVAIFEDEKKCQQALE